MIPADPAQPSSAEAMDRAIEQDIRQHRPYSLADAIGKEASGFLKGESMLPKLQQVHNELTVFVRQHLVDPSGALHATLHDLIQSDNVVCSRYFDAPLAALVALLQPLITQEARLHAFVQQVDMRWGQMYDERPHFQQPGQPPHPDDEYTHESVRSQLIALVTIAQHHES